MKRQELVRRLGGFGWYLLREGRKHEIWTNGELQEPLPRHREIDEYLARKLLRIAREHPAATGGEDS